jgi:tight adherence protein C
MLDLVLAKVGDTHFMAVILLSMGCAAGVLMALMPFLQTDNLARRMKDVSTERERIRMRERERLVAAQSKTSLRYKSGGITKTVTESLNLASWLNTDTAKQQLNQAGFRGAGAENAFLTFRFVAPILFFFVALIYVFFIAKLQWAFTFKVCAAIFAAYLGIARNIPQQQKDQTSKIDGAGLSEHGRPVDHMRRVGNVHRACRSESEHGDRRRKHRAG